MIQELSLSTTAIKAEQIVGTKWTTWRKLYGDRFSVEFVDKSNCIYTAQPNKYTLAYSVKEGKLFIKNIDGAFELRGNVLFNNENPVFEKTA